MHKHVGYELVEMEICGLPIMQSESRVEVYSTTTYHYCCQEANDVDDKQIFCYCGYLLHIPLFIRRLSLKTHNFRAKLLKKGVIRALRWRKISNLVAFLSIFANFFGEKFSV